ncbi:hypothetical protein GGI12_005948 [Dipsacomyces acuminosporus]|nr:hypothetical protein GGI12_005948 [Dipsacomyces acuminosporus]
MQRVVSTVGKHTLTGLKAVQQPAAAATATATTAHASSRANSTNAKASLNGGNDAWKEQEGQHQQPPVSALDSAGIELIRSRLASAEQKGTPAHLHFKYQTPEPSSAAVLVALCTVDGQVSVLFEERNNKLATHGGEVCFAGGKVDPTDKSLVHTALRETFEEIGIAEKDIRVIGKLPPVPNYKFTMRVHPVVGVVGSVSSPLDIKSLNVNKTEVHRVFALPLEHFFDPRNRSAVPFRNSKVMIPSYKSDKPGLQIWGLTAFILQEFFARIANPSSDMAPAPDPNL